MKILLTNDDGYRAPGIAALAKELEKNHEVIIVAPEVEHSGQSHAITLGAPLIVREETLPDIRSKVYSVTGTPADCVRVAMDYIVKDHKIDVVFSGCNLGYNAGMDIVYSGTVSAAIEANVYHLPAVAVSTQWVNGSLTYDTAAKFSCQIFEQVKPIFLEKSMVLNINVPYGKYDDIKGVKVCEIGGPIYDYYFMEPNNDGSLSLQLKGRNAAKLVEGTDRYYLDQGFVTVTPLIYDLTNKQLINEFKSWL